MALRIVLSVSLVLAACQTAPQSAAPSSADVATLHAQLEEARTLQGAQFGLLTTLLADRTGSPIGQAAEPAGTTELNARLAALSQRLDELLLRLPAPTPAPAVEASATRQPGANDEAGVQMLQQALSVVETMRNVTLENLANVNTPGFKKRQVAVSTVLHEASGMQVPTAGRIGSVWTSGALEITERQLDVAIDGDGFFRVVRADGQLGYTRNGSFLVDADGKLVAGTGEVLSPEITVPSDALEISIAPDGAVIGRCAGNPDASTRFGEIQLSRFIAPQGLTAAGNCQMSATLDSGSPVTGKPGQQGLGVLKQGFVERSNVQVVNELINLQLAERQRTMLRRVLAEQGFYVR